MNTLTATKKLTAIAVATAAFVLGVASPASAEVDATKPALTTSGTLRGRATVKVNWPTGPAWNFSSISVEDTSADGFCITPFVNVNRRLLPNTGYIHLNGNVPGNAISDHPYGMACGKGATFSGATSVYNSPRPISGLTGAYGVWIRVCQTNSRGVVTGSCGAPSYAANDGR